jgi:nitrogen-specific signal transduction histidine kinase
MMMNYQELLTSPLIPSSLVEMAKKAAKSKVPVLIYGEPGTGKDLLAKIIHYTGDWRYQPFHTVDGRILWEEPFQVQLFRLIKEIEKEDRPFTLYLKEVGALEPQDQIRLLELVEEGIFQNEKEKKVFSNIRFISSTSENLKEKVTQGKFLQDLYYRLSTLTFLLPPLRQRTKELSSIVQYLLEENAKKMRIRKIGISPSALRLLENYWWPRNLRELEEVLLRSAVSSEGEKIMEKDLFFETEYEKNPLLSFLEKLEKRPNADTMKPQEKSTQDPTLFFIELVHRIKNPLVSIKTFTQLLRDKFNDPEFRDYFYKIVTEDIERIDEVLNGLLNYIKINHPLEKRGTVHAVLEEVLKKYESQIENKQIKVLRKYERDLPEVILHEEQLRYILNSLLQYAIPSIPPHGTIGVLTKSINGLREGTEEKETQEGKYIEILILFTGLKRPIEPAETLFGIPLGQEKELTDLEIRLVKELIQKNRGEMKFELNEKKLRTLISLRLPVERRRVIYYQSHPF